VTVIAKGEGELTTLVSETARPVVMEALSDYLGVTEDSLDHARSDKERNRLQDRRELIESLRRQLDGTTGQLHLTGPEELVTAVVKAATSIATHDLDGIVSSLTTQSAPLDVEGREDLRARATLATSCVETLISCEGSRQRV